MVDRLIKTLDGSPVCGHPSCFFLTWEGENVNAKWITLSDMNKANVKFSAYVKWKELRGQVLIATDFKGAPHIVDSPNDYKNKEYLKSHLQKVIRRSNHYKALKTAYQFIDLDISDFLRRLCIIALEDALPLEGFSILTWFTAAVSKGYVMSSDQVCWCLGYVYDLAHCTQYEQAPTDQIDQVAIKDMRLMTLPQEGKDLVYSILFREAYGGMNGDKVMCRSLAAIWASRFHTKSVFLKLLKRENKYITPPTQPLDKKEWVLNAIDFHCCPNIIYSIKEKHDQYEECEIKSAIWHCGSSITDKKLIGVDLKYRNPDEYINIWKVIKKDVLSYASYMLNKNG